MNAIRELKVISILKNIIKTLIIDYPQNATIDNENSLYLLLNDIIFKATSNTNLFTPARLNILLHFLIRKLIRGSLIPRTTQDLLLELIEILESVLRIKNSINILTEQLFPNEY